MLRGGSFNNNAHNVRSAYRNNNNPDNRNNKIGFRVASTLRQTHSFVMPESTGQILARLPCEACLVQSPGRRARVGRRQLRSAKQKTGPAGLVGRKTRSPCRATFALCRFW